MPKLTPPRELTFNAEILRGTKGARARLVQEWLCLQGQGVAVDNDFGVATRTAVEAFQEARGLGVTGRVDEAAFAALTDPMRAALAPLAAPPETLGKTVVAVAEQHLAQHPREVGGENRGPWVRLYMDGRDGKDWPWCAGFVCLILRQACAALDRLLPFPRTVSCDVLAGQAKERGLFIAERTLINGPAHAALPPGTVFLNRRTARDWTHTGLVTRAAAETFQTIEGNTNDEGSREGFEVCARTRGYKKRDFIALE